MTQSTLRSSSVREPDSPWSRFNPGPTAEKIWRCRKRIIAIEGPVGTAKSSIFCLYIAAHCAENPGAVWLVVRRTYQMLRDNTISGTWLKWFPEGVAGTMDGFLNFSLNAAFMGQRAIGEIRFRPADRPEDVSRFMGGEYAGVALDEVTGTYREMGLPEDVYTGLNLRLRQPGIGWACAQCGTALDPSRIPDSREIILVDCPTCGGAGTCIPRYHMLLAFNSPPPGHWVDREFPLPERETEDSAHFRIPPRENLPNLPHGYYQTLARQLKAKEDWLARFLDGERVPIGKAHSVFDRATLMWALGPGGWVRDPEATGVLERSADTGNVRMVPLTDGPLRVWELPRPKDEDRYVIGTDSGEGVQEGDASCAHVLSRRTGHLVAEWHGHLSPKRFAREVAMLGWWYNEAMVCPEVEPSAAGRTTCDELEHLGYCNLYQGRREQVVGDPPTRRYGLPMSRFNKSRLVGRGREVLQERTNRIPVRETLNELLNYVQHPDGRLGADEGTHDDRVVAWLCALEALERTGTWKPLPRIGETPQWQRDLLARVPGGPVSDRSWMAW